MTLGGIIPDWEKLAWTKARDLLSLGALFIFSLSARNHFVETLDICFNGTRLSLAQRVSRWREAVGDHLVDVDMRAPHGAPAKEAFTGSMSLTLLGKDSIATIEASHQVLVRTPERIRRAERETALLTLVLSGECLISQEGRSSLLKPGDLCVYESVKPYRIDVSAKMTAVVATTDRARLEAALGDLRLYTGPGVLIDCTV